MCLVNRQAFPPAPSEATIEEVAALQAEMTKLMFDLLVHRFVNLNVYLLLSQD